MNRSQPQGHHHRKGWRHAEKGVHLGPAGYGAVHGD
jgi:hypothetical protein